MQRVASGTAKKTKCYELDGTLHRLEVLSQALRIIHGSRVKPMKLVVDSLAGGEFTLDISNISTVVEVKELIEKKKNIPVMEQRLLFGVLEPANTDPIQHDHATLVRQREVNVYEQLRTFLSDEDQHIQDFRSHFSSFIHDVLSPIKWIENCETEPCGCSIVTKHYAGKEPPSSTTCSALCANASKVVSHCRKQLNDIKDADLKRHREHVDELRQIHLHEKNAQADFSWFMHSCLFTCCLAPSAPPHDNNVHDLEAHCRRLLKESEQVRRDFTHWTTQAATQTKTTNCALHMPPPPEPGSP